MFDENGRFRGGNPADYYEALENIKNYDELADDALNRSQVRPPADAPSLGDTRPPRAVTRGFWLVDAALTGLAIKQDIEAGESTAQAVSSNAGGTLAGIGAATLTGAAIGSAIPIPGVGTAAGAIVGAGVGIITSGAIDHMFNEGVENIGDVGEALWEGTKGLGNTLADAGNAIGDGISNAWDAIF